MVPTEASCSPKMDPVNIDVVTPNRSRLSRTFAKVMHIRALTGISPAGMKNAKEQMTSCCKSFDEGEERRRKEVTEAFLAKLFSSISSIKAAYAEMQFAEAPYDSETIQSADEMVVSELKILSELKQCYFTKQVDESSPGTTQLLAEIKELQSVTKTLKIMEKTLNSEHEVKQSELTFAREKLKTAKRENKLLEKRLNSSEHLSPPKKFHFSILSTSNFITILRQTVKAIRSFVRLMISEMESAGWDLDAAANSIEPGVVYSSDVHKSFAFESFVCKELFAGFNDPYFSISKQSMSDKKRQQRQFFERFMMMKSQKPKEYLTRKPDSTFAKFCRTKYMGLVHPKMEASLFGNLSQRKLLTSGGFPDTDFFSLFSEMAMKVWILHCLAYSFEPEASVFQVDKKCRFSEVFMECINEEAFLSAAGTVNTDPRVAFTVVPGFKIGKTVIQSQVYLT
ncbi:protein GRAVITROPIC IN THE LIGHT 1-like isoform X1 [Apium graveolens]|uniref:protein GRAVITROPIC IN THE LIGHT 1-like isoform X1 n=1 Tax=Apium graveolens TaxID=4045 RepID=UPI003D7B8EAD